MKCSMPEIELKSIGERIRQLRKQNGMTQEQLAELLDVSIQMVSNLERGNKAIRISNLVRLSEILGVSTDFILTGRMNDVDIGGDAGKFAELSEQNRNMIRMLIDYCIKNQCFSRQRIKGRPFVLQGASF